MPPWWKTTLRPVCADVATTAAAAARPLDVRSMRSNGITRSSVALQRRRVEQRRNVEREQAGEVQRAAHEPLEVAEGRRREHVAPADASQIARPASSAASTPSGSVAAR